MLPGALALWPLAARALPLPAVHLRREAPDGSPPSKTAPRVTAAVLSAVATLFVLFCMCGPAVGRSCNGIARCVALCTRWARRPRPRPPAARTVAAAFGAEMLRRSAPGAPAGATADPASTSAQSRADAATSVYEMAMDGSEAPREPAEPMEPGEPAEPTEPAASPPPAFDPQDSGGSETLTKEQFAALPVQTYGSIRRHTRASFDQQGDPECAICQSEYEAGDVVTRVPCLHFFHQDCIQQWLTKGAGHCPICRCTVTVDLDE